MRFGARALSVEPRVIVCAYVRWYGLVANVATETLGRQQQFLFGSKLLLKDESDG